MEIPATELDDPKAMARYFKRLARLLLGPETMNEVADKVAAACRDISGSS